MTWTREGQWERTNDIFWQWQDGEKVLMQMWRRPIWRRYGCFFSSMDYQQEMRPMMTFGSPPKSTTPTNT